MIGFPKHIATRQDYENLLSMEEYKEEALLKLKELAAFDDRKVTRATKQINPKDPMSDWETKLIDNPLPLHAQKGFIDKEQKTKADIIKQGWFEVPKLIAVTEKRKYEDVLEEYKESQPEIKPTDEKEEIMEEVVK
jgi:hypothetical protein